MEIRFNRFPGGCNKALLFSFDDGRTEDRQLLSLMNQYGIKGTFHLNSGLLGRGKHIQPEEIQSLYDGHEVAAHTYHHVYLKQLPSRMQVKELMEDKEALEELSGHIVRGLSWPYGSYCSETETIARLSGYEYSRTTQDSGRLEPPEDLFAWHPTAHHSKMTDEVWNRFWDDHRNDMQILMLWGHSYEFDTTEKWERLAKLFSTIGGRQDVWYTTCIQMAEYLNAVRRLALSASMKKIYNPSAVAVWIEANGEKISIPGGEEVALSDSNLVLTNMNHIDMI